MTEKDDKDPKEPAEETSVEEAADVEAVEGETGDVDLLKRRARERDEYLDLLQRTRAEYLNYRKRVEREKLRLSDLAVGAFVLKLLPVIDDFDRALAHVDQTPDLETFARGIQLIENKLYDVLKASRVEVVAPEGQRFDPSEHEAVHVEYTDDVPDQTVVEVLRRGYRLDDRILRPAQVRVAMRPPEESPQANGSDVETSDEEE